ncbi:TetR/AcrR family transcriptional regulator [Pseudomonas sp. NPDC089734]|uniref:TetR/AcrR family transcriptional regulator n=1 Tax=Pseudomonas sp. NPDC089734 TaxID=3364469 RepID=UPI00380EFE19
MRVKTEARRQAIIDSAGQLFLEQGYDSVTMAQIAAKVGGSKVTLYNYFASKEAVFEAFVIEAGRADMDRLQALPEDAGIVETLRGLGRNYLLLVLSPAVMELDRLIIGEARRIPELSRIFYENGPRKTLEHLDRNFARLLEKGRLRTAEPRALTLHFKALCESDLFERQLWGQTGTPSDKDIDQAVEDAVRVFLHGYAASESS